jgi:diacylglycerol kinase family enzyme
MRPRVTILVNPHAGAGTNDAAALAEALFAAGAEPAVTRSTGSSLYTDARNAIRDSPIIVAAGGDGTVSTVASALAGTDRTLGVLPLGTLNHFAKDLGIPQDLENAAKTIAEGHTVRVDVGEVNGRIFINNSGVGAYPHLVAERRAQQQQHHTRWLSDLMAALKVLRDYRRLQVEVRGADITRTVSTPFVFVGNNEYQLEGLKFGARPRLDRGTLHVAMAPDISRAGFVRLVASALIGGLSGNTQFETISLPEFAIRAARRHLLVSLDGEVALLDTPLKYRIRCRALRVIAPATSSITDSGRSVA